MTGSTVNPGLNEGWLALRGAQATPVQNATAVPTMAKSGSKKPKDVWKIFRDRHKKRFVIHADFG
jgi:hypothetical protein